MGAHSEFGRFARVCTTTVDHNTVRINTPVWLDICVRAGCCTVLFLLFFRFISQSEIRHTAIRHTGAYAHLFDIDVINVIFEEALCALHTSYYQNYDWKDAIYTVPHVAMWLRYSSEK